MTTAVAGWGLQQLGSATMVGVWEEKMGPGCDNIININTVIHTPVSYKISFYHTQYTFIVYVCTYIISTVSIIYDNLMLLH